jgi:hypothetical protein
MRGKLFLGMISLVRSARSILRASPREHFGDLGGARFTGDHRQIQNPHEHLKIRSHNMKVRRPVIIGVHAHTSRRQTGEESASVSLT